MKRRFLYCFWSFCDFFTWLASRFAPRDGKVEDAWDYTSGMKLHYRNKDKDEYISWEESRRRRKEND